MCGRFVQYSDPEAIAEHFQVDADLSCEARYNVAPTQPVLAVRLDQDGARELVRLRWGLIPFWSKGPDNRFSMINARAETVASKPAYRAAFAKRRCLIPADAFYEWQPGQPHKTPYAIRRLDQSPFAMAGLWERWKSDEGQVIESCTIIVTEANALLAPIHDRMPVILEPGDYKPWLATEGIGMEQLQTLLRPADPEGWQAYPVSRAVNRPGNDSPALLEPA